MPQYIVNSNKQANGDNEVHQYPRSLCNSPNYPAIQNQVSLGSHTYCRGAVEKAKRMGYNANGCWYCARACHTT